MGYFCPVYRITTARTSGLAFLLTALGVCSTACGGRADDSSYHNPTVPDERLPAATASFEEQRCGKLALTLSDSVIQCGTVEVPLAPQSVETLEISVVRVFTDSVRPKPDPVIYLDGGPGVATLESVEYLIRAFRPMFPDRDLIFFDQRGVGRSEPTLHCTGTGEVTEVLDECYAEWSSQVDLNSYRSVNNAHDVAAIAQAFGYETLNLFGISYGTRLALTVLREHPAIVRSAIIDSVVPLQEDLFAQTGENGYSALLTVFEACAEDFACSNKYPNLSSDLLKVVEGLNQEPFTVDESSIDGTQLIAVIFQMMYSSELIPYIPYFIDDIASGSTYFLESMLSYTSEDSGFSMGMHLSLQCAEEIAFSSPAAFLAHDELVDPVLREAFSAAIYLDYCQHWPVTSALPVENQAVVSDVPTLVLTGKFDPITPPSFAMAALESLSQAQFFLLESESHGASVGACGQNLVRGFTDNPRGSVDGTCVLDPPGLEFESRSVKAPGRSEGSRIAWQLDQPTDEELEQAMTASRIRRRMVIR